MGDIMQSHARQAFEAELARHLAAACIAAVSRLSGKERHYDTRFSISWRDSGVDDDGVDKPGAQVTVTAVSFSSNSELSVELKFALGTPTEDVCAVVAHETERLEELRKQQGGDREAMMKRIEALKKGEASAE